ncbi:winged helix-turn-helix domain-containing protein [Barnesiella sp.]|nr:winged helix-turn-helix domain-containing protein [Barnesiella sp.]
MKEKELYAALGWLAREGKVSMYEVDADIEVVLL